MKKVLFVFAISAMMILSSCTKPGPEGPAGKDGTSGINGTNGINGIDGNANVISSNSVVTNNWITIYDDGIYFTYSSTITWASITQAIVDKGLVIVYAKDGTSWLALPYTQTESSLSLTLTYRINVNTVTIEYSGYDSEGSPGANTANGLTFRIVAIPASVAMINQDINFKNYEEVKALFNLK